MNFPCLWLGTPFPLEIGYYRGGLRAVQFLTRALYDLIYNYPLISFLPAPTMTHMPSSDDPMARLPPPPANKGHLLCLGWQTSLPILAGDNGDPTDGGDTIASPPSIRDDGKFLMALWDDSDFLMALSATGPRTTPPHLAVLIEGILVVLGRHLVELNKATCLAVASSVSGFLQAMEASKAHHRQALEVNAAQNRQALEVNAAQNRQALEAHRASFQQYVGEANKSNTTITTAHNQSMTDM
jgi:hypothetical protein